MHADSAWITDKKKQTCTVLSSQIYSHDENKKSNLEYNNFGPSIIHVLYRSVLKF